MALAIKYKRRRISAVRTFPQGCGPAAPAAVVIPYDVTQPNPSETSKSQEMLRASTSTEPRVTSLEPISGSKPAVEEQIFNPPRRFPKRRKISAVRTFPAGCGRTRRAAEPVASSVIKNLGEEPKPAAAALDASSVIKNLGEEPKPPAAAAARDASSEIKNLGEESKPATAALDASSEIKNLKEEPDHIGVATMEPVASCEIKNLGEEEPKPLAIDTSFEIKSLNEEPDHTTVATVVKADSKERDVAGEQTQERGQAMLEWHGEEPTPGNLWISELSEESTPSPTNARAQSRSRSKIVGKGSGASMTKGGKGSVKNQMRPKDGTERFPEKEGDDPSKALGDRLIVQCLMAAPNCPWRRTGSLTTLKGSTSRIKAGKIGNSSKK